MTTPATPETFSIFLPGEYPVAGASAFIERDSDHFIFDANGDQTFKADGTAGLSPMIPLVQDTGSFIGRPVARVVLNPAQFADGDYIVNFCRPDLPVKPIFSMAVFTVLSGSATTPLLSLDNIAKAVVAALPTTSGGTAPTAKQNADAVIAELPAYPVPPSADTVANAVVAKLPTSVGGAPTAAQNASAFANFQYKTVTDPGTVSALFASINTGLGNVPALGSRIDNVATALAALNTGLGNLGTNQHNNFATFSTTITGLQTRQDNVGAALKFLNDSLTALSTNQHNNLLNTNTTMGSIQTQLTALANQLASLTTTVNAINKKVNGTAVSGDPVVK
jgi:hypothetical protein